VERPANKANAGHPENVDRTLQKVRQNRSRKASAKPGQKGGPQGKKMEKL
jgi:hypothetical protein